MLERWLGWRNDDSTGGRGGSKRCQVGGKLSTNTSSGHTRLLQFLNAYLHVLAVFIDVLGCFDAVGRDGVNSAIEEEDTEQSIKEILHDLLEGGNVRYLCVEKSQTQGTFEAL